MLSRAIDCSGGHQISGKSIGAALSATQGASRRWNDFGRVSDS